MEKLFEKLPAFKFNLLYLGGAKDEVECDSLVEAAFCLNFRIYIKVKGVSVRLFSEEAFPGAELTAVDKFPRYGCRSRVRSWLIGWYRIAFRYA